MVGLIVALLVILWLLGMVTPGAISGYLPILAIVAAVVLVVRLASGRHAY
jgi:hypothetical protein